MPSEDHDDAIRKRAYLLWEQAGKPQGREHEFWAQASAEIEGGSVHDAEPGDSRIVGR